MLKTLHLDASNPAAIQQAAAILRRGDLVAFATETVYGLGANALSAQAVAAIFAAKQRPAWDPLIVHLASPRQLAQIAMIPPSLSTRIQALINTFWPGPLTLLLPRTPAVPDAVTAGRRLVGVRVPKHPAAQALLAAAALPVAAPSANRFGHTSPTTAAHVLADLDGRIHAVLDAGPTSVGVESTVLDPTQTPMRLYRPGAITSQQLLAATGIAVETFLPPSGASPLEPSALPSPGFGIRHYAPQAHLELVDGSVQALCAAVQKLQTNPITPLTAHPAPVGLLLPTDWNLPKNCPLHPGVVVVRWASWSDPKALATSLFAGLRALDDLKVLTILCPLPPSGGLGDAIRDRLQKAARS
ncbi:MAG: L-threonylcarbamoyladenylate synthase [Acidobacteriaceae bacterium]